MDRTFSRDDTKLMKGAAIVLMLMHHLWGFPGRIAGGGVMSTELELSWKRISLK